MIVMLMHPPRGAMYAPRFPTFVGFREAWDL
jgi:hypothetical protein